MPVIPAGTINPNSVVAPNVYVIEELPQPIILGVPTDIIGLVGTAIWGPTNSPQLIPSLTDYVGLFGDPQTNKFDMGTHVNAITSLGANDMRCVRVTDGTDVAALTLVLDTGAGTGMTVTSKYTGTKGNDLQVSVTEGSDSTVALPSFKVTVQFPTGLGVNIPEVFDNLGKNLTGLPVWQAMVDAINLGQSSLRGPSLLVVATVGASAVIPAITTTPYIFTGGTNGNSSVVVATLVGVDVAPRTGMFALRGSGLALLDLCDVDDATTYAAQVSFSEFEGCYAILTRPIGESVSAAITAKKAAALDSPFAKLLVGDYTKINDSFNNVQRFISPQGFTAARLAILSPEESGLNKQIVSTILVGTQSSEAQKIYSNAEIVEILQGGLDVIATPSPGGNYFALQTGKNTSSNLLANGDNFTRLTNFIAFSLSDNSGIFVGQLQTQSERQSAKTAIQSFLQDLADQGQIGAVDGSQPYTVVLDDSNNPPNRVAQGFMQADVNVAFFQVIVAFLVNLQTGDVTVTNVINQ